MPPISSTSAQRLLTDAIMGKDRFGAQAALRAGADPNAVDEDGGMLPLGLACAFGAQTIAEDLMLAGAQLRGLDAYGCTAALNAAERGQGECLRLLLRSGVDPNEIHLSTPLLCEAAGNDSFECVEILLQAGADIEARDAQGETPFLCAARWGHERCAQRLMLAGADIAAVNEEGHGAAWLARSNNHTALAERIEGWATAHSERQAMRADIPAPAAEARKPRL